MPALVLCGSILLYREREDGPVELRLVRGERARVVAVEIVDQARLHGVLAPLQLRCPGEDPLLTGANDRLVGPLGVGLRSSYGVGTLLVLFQVLPVVRAGPVP